MILTTHNHLVTPTYWQATLSNGLVVFQDDYNPAYVQEHSAWIRLKKYCQQNKLYITNLILVFRTHIIDIPQNKDGYYFSKGVTAWCSDDKTYHQYIVGYVEDDKVYTTSYIIPELEPMFYDVRECNACLDNLIMKNYNV